MSRTLPTGLSAHLVSNRTVYPAFLVELDWPTGTVYAWTGYHTLSWDSKSWVGTGHLGGLSEIGESGDNSANGVSLTLSGLPSAVVANALENDAQCRPGKLYFGVINGASFSIDPYLVFDGLIDVCTISDDGSTATVTVNLEKELYDNRGSARRYTYEDQVAVFPGDLGLEYVAGLANKQFAWGKSASNPISRGGGGSGKGSTGELE